MKKAIILLVILVAFSMNESKAQRYITSVGVTQTWGVPNAVMYALDDHYYDYNIVHVNRLQNPRLTSFNVLLSGSRGFVEVEIGGRGHILGRTYHRINPLHNHVCGAYCGYHGAYYATHFRPVHKRSHVTTYHYGTRGYQYDRYRANNKIRYRNNHYDHNHRGSTHRNDTYDGRNRSRDGGDNRRGNKG